uniref:Generative cell specific-1/HAP2 domain-containing protein n=1 Tax=Chenopodium quinoa TaxID=63459 RepID=A0A803KME1_CHEQI
MSFALLKFFRKKLSLVPEQPLRFTLDGLECNKIGVGYEAFNGQPDFCTSPYWSCLHNQLWNFYEADQNRIARHQPPLYGVVGRFERINEHPGAGPRTFSFGISEAINTNLVIELAADDIEYVYQRIPGKILGVTVPTFEALAQYGTADIKTKNTGKVEASYSLTFKCSKGVTMMEEQFFIMKPEEVGNRSFKIYLTSDQASKYACSAILKDSEFNEVDRAECQFTTTATVLDNGTQGAPFQPPKSETAKLIWNYQRPMEQVLGWFIRLHHRKELQHLNAITINLDCNFFCWHLALVLLWLLHQKGLFDPLYDWWEDHCWEGTPRHKKIPRHRIQHDHHRIHHKRHRPHHHRAHHHHDVHQVKHRQRKNNNEQDHHHAAHRSSDYNQYLHHVHKDKHIHGKHRSCTGAIQHLDNQGDLIRQHRHRKGRRANERTSDFQIYDKEDIHEPYENEPSFL